MSVARLITYLFLNSKSSVPPKEKYVPRGSKVLEPQVWHEGEKRKKMTTLYKIFVGLKYSELQTF